MAAALPKVKKTRGIYRGQTKKTENEITNLFEHFQPEEIVKLTALKNTDINKLNKVKEIDQQ